MQAISFFKAKATIGMTFSVVLLIGTVSGISADPAQPQIIQLNDGTKLTFLGLTYGKRHMAPGHESLPTGNPIFTPNGATVAWIEAEHEPGRWPSYELLISDPAGAGCANMEQRSSSHVRDGVDVQGFVLDAFPRWEKQMMVRVRPFQGAIAAGRFVVSNSAQSSWMTWTAEPMPLTKRDGDLEVTLSNLIAGVSIPHRRDKPAPENDPANQCVRIVFGWRQNGMIAMNWRPRLVQTSDSSGNRVRGMLSEYPQDGIFGDPQVGKPEIGRAWDGYFYRPGLWPDASPWKIRMEFTRTNGFDADEILILTNLAVRTGTQSEADEQWTWDESKTNFSSTACTVNGLHLKVLEPLWYPAKIDNGQSHIRVMIYSDINPVSLGMRLTLLEATDEQEDALWAFPSAWAGHFDLDLPRSREIKTLSLRLALHKSRFVEFTIKPTRQ